MKSVPASGHLWPTPEQELLLAAALSRDEDALAAWRSWKARIPLDSADDGSRRLFPLAYRNLRSLDVRDPEMEMLKAAWQRSWSENQLLFHHMAAALRRFHDAGIETILLKGAALSLLYYKDMGVRPMADFDLLVPRESALQAVRLLQSWGWKSEAGGFHPERLIPVRHSMGFTGGPGESLDLHWRVFLADPDPEGDAAFRRDAVPVDFRGQSTRALNPTDQLLHVCVHGAAWNPVPPLRWIADAVTVLRASADRTDWRRLIVHARGRCMLLPSLETLGYLRTRWNAPVPVWVLEELRRIPVSNFERVARKIRSRPAKKIHPLLSLHYNYHLFLRASGNGTLARKISGFAAYLKHFWALDHMGQVPAQALLRGLRRTTAAWTRRLRDPGDEQ